MKKIIALCSVLLLSIFLTACGQNNDHTNDQLENDETEGEHGNTGDNSPSNQGQVEDNSPSNQGQVEDNEPDNDVGLEESNLPDQAENQDDMKNMMEALGFDELEMEVSYGRDQEYELEIEHHSHGDVEAEIEDEINGVDIDDDLQAFNHIYPYVKELDVDRSMEKQTLIDQVLEAFELEDNYEKFEVEITFPDGTKLSVEDRK